MSTSVPHSRPTLEADDTQSVIDVIQSDMIAEGDQCLQFESEFADYLGTPGAVAVSSGTLALQIALLTLGVGAGDRVAAPTYMCRAPLDACAAIGCRTVLVDSASDYNLEVNRLADNIEGCKAIIIPHILGITADIGVAKDLGVPVIEDCAQAAGGESNGRKLGTLGDVAMFSFHATKMMSTGEGGMFTSMRPELIEKARQIKLDGFGASATGFRGRHLFPMTDIQAALGRSQLRRLDSFVQKRKEIADRYFTALERTACELPHQMRTNSVFYRFPLKPKMDVDECIAQFAKLGVNVRKPVAVLLHQLAGVDGKAFPGAEQLLQELLSLPIYPSLTDNEFSVVIDAVRRVLT